MARRDARSRSAVPLAHGVTPPPAPRSLHPGALLAPQLQQQKQQQQQQQNGGAQPAAAAAAVTKPKGKKALAAAAAKAAAAAAVAPAAAAAAAPMAATPATPAAATPVAISTARLGLRTRYVTPTATAATATVNAPTKPKKASAKAAKHNKKAAALAAAIAAGNVTNTTTAPLNTKDTARARARARIRRRRTRQAPRAARSPQLLNLHYLSEFSAYQHFSNAICNDASVPGFYHGIATNPQLAHIWVVYLQGGGFCYDAESCDARMRATPWLVSSQMVSSATMGVPTLKPRWPAQIHMGGIFGNDLRRNPLAGANMIYVPYCSSDLWVGNAGLDSSFNALRRVTNAMGYPGWSFRGQYILKATLAVLVRIRERGFTTTTMWPLPAWRAAAHQTSARNDPPPPPSPPRWTILASV